MKRRLSIAEIAAMTAAASAQTAGLPKAKSPDDITTISVIELSVYDVDLYDHNPRVIPNAKYAEIKHSISVRGLDSKLFITKRPGSKRYMLAKGGNTRLQILRELAKDDPAKWEKYTFEIVPYACESEVLAAHLVENTGRSGLCFWDLAQGIADIGETLAQELGKPISQKALPDLLKERGVEVKRNVIMDAEFALRHLKALGPWREYLLADHVYDYFRPNLTALQAIWGQTGQAPAGLSPMLDEAITQCVNSRADYSVGRLLDAMINAVAQHLECSTTALADAVELKIKGQLNTPEELRAVLKAAHAENADPSTEDHEAQQTPPASTPGAPPSSATDTPPSRSDGLNYLAKKIAEGQQKRTTDLPGMPGVSVMHGLVPHLPKRKPPVHGGSLSQAELALLEEQGDLGLAKQVLNSELMTFATHAGIDHLVRDATTPYLCYYYYLELPKPGELGASEANLAVQAWWLLTNVSGQFDTVKLEHIAASPSDVQTLHDGNFKTAVSDLNTLREVVTTCLGGQQPYMFELLFSVLTHREHELHQVSINLLDACANLNSARARGNS